MFILTPVSHAFLGKCESAFHVQAHQFYRPGSVEVLEILDSSLLPPVVEILLFGLLRLLLL